MPLDMLHLSHEPTATDWQELSSYAPAADGFEWRDLLTERDIDASYSFNGDVGRLLHSLGAPARLHELGGLLLVTTVREAMQLAVCVLRLVEIGELSSTTTDGVTVFASAIAVPLDPYDR